MTVSGLSGHFTLYVHYYERPLIHYLLLIYSRSVVCLLPGTINGPWFITRDQGPSTLTRDVTSAQVREAEHSKR